MKTRGHGLQLYFHGAAGTVTGSSTVLSMKANGSNQVYNILADSGVALGEEKQGPVLKQPVDVILVSHAHADHSGRVPQVAIKNPNAPIYIPGGAKGAITAIMADAWKHQEKSREIGIVNTSYALCRNWLGSIISIDTALGRRFGRKSVKLNRGGRKKKTIGHEETMALRDDLERERDGYMALIQAKIGDSFPKEEPTTNELESIIDTHFAQEKTKMKEDGIVTNEGLQETIKRLEERTLGKAHKILPNGSEKTTLIMKNTGHLVTAPAVQILIENARGKNILFSGDRGNDGLPAPFEKPDDEGFENKADFLILESTYGGRTHKNRQEELSKMDTIVLEAIKKGEDIVIPIISLDRPVIVFFEIINRLINSGAIKADEVELLYFGDLIQKLFNLIPKEHAMWKTVRKYIKPLLKDQLKNLQKKGKKSRIILAGGGFLPTEGSPAGAVLENALTQDEITILFTNYFGGENSNAGNLIAGRPFLLTRDNQFPHQLKKGHKAHYIGGFSGHADTPQLVDYAAKVIRENGTIFLNHGTEESRGALKQALEIDSRIKSKKIKIVLPKQGRTYVLK